MSFYVLWRQIVAQYRNETAIRIGEKTLSYAKVDELSGRIAMKLQQMGCHKETKIGILMEKTERPILVMLACLKLGCVYVPLSRLYPATRIQKIIDIAEINRIVCEEEITWLLPEQQVIYESLLISNETFSFDASLKPQEGNQDVYILFTSGTTGEPKGVCIGWESILNLVDEMKTWFPDRKETFHVGVIAPYIFDISVGQIYYALFTGNVCVVIPDAVKEDVRQCIEYVQEKQIDVLDMTPTYLKMIEMQALTDNQKLRYPEYLIACGEPLSIDTAKQFFERYEEECKPKLMNAYGPTETCVYASKYWVTPERLESMQYMSIGQALMGYELYILDSNQKLCPMEVEGELYIGGKGLAKEYINRPELTRNSFLMTQYGRLYKTGDLAVLHSDGEIQLFGRNDSQVKIHGRRIELGEIELAINEIKGMKECRVRVEKQNEETVIVAYFQSDSEFTLEFLVEALEKVLPMYMLPAYFVPVVKFSMGNTGKLDVTSLPEYHTNCLRQKKNPMLNSMEHLTMQEQEFLELCKKSLGLDELSFEENFFQAGGDSLALFWLNVEIWNRWEVRIRTARLNACSSIREMYDLVRMARTGTIIQKPVEEIHEQQEIPVTFLQSYIIKLTHKLKRQVVSRTNGYPLFDLVYRIHVNQYLEPERLKEALNQVIANNEMLRTSIHKKGTSYCLQLHKEGINPLEVIMVEEFHENYIQENLQVFQLEELPLFQFQIYETPRGEQEVILHFHHVIFDYGSFRIFFEQLFMAYDHKLLPKPSMDFFRYSQSHHEVEPKTKDFWKSYLKDRKVLCSNQTKYSLSSRDKEYQSKSFEFNEVIYDRIFGLAREYQTTPFQIMLIALAIWRYAKEQVEDFTLGSVFHGRDGDEDTSIIGVFTSILCVRFRMNGQMSISEVIRQNIANLKSVMEHQKISIYEIMKQMSIEEVMKGELFDLLLNYVDLDEMTFQDMKYRIQTEELDPAPGYCKLQIVVYPNRTDHIMRLDIFYEKDSFLDSEIEEFVECYGKVLERMIKQPEECLKGVNFTI